ncbi:MAG: hypothetical protein AAF654_07015 [Myxococcota bacterium]
MRICICLCTALLASAATASAATPELFAEGRTRLSVAAGSGRFAGTNRIIVGGGLGYFIVDGLELSIEADAWFGGDVGLARVSPSARYVFWQITGITPYAGAFYRRWFVGAPFDDLDTVGVRLGGFAGRTGQSYLGLGLAYERQVAPECSESCSYLYPELTVALGF